MTEFSNSSSPIKNALKTNPKISIITPSLNQGAFIEATILSVLSQNYPNLEYIVMDGGSSDNTIKILEKYSDRIKWTSEKDKGQTHAINKGLRAASGDIVAYLNADDLFLPRTLFRIAQVFNENPKAMWVTGQCRIIDEMNNEIRRPITTYKNMLLRARSARLLLITDYISQPATFWRRDILDDLGYPHENLHYAMDYEYWLRLYYKYPLVFIPEYLAAFRIHPQSKTTSTGHKDVFIDEEKVVIQQYAHSKLFLFLHNAHRWLMTSVYSIINKI